jgi:ABA DEFICIENT 4-like
VLFELAFPLAAPFWALMIFAPGWRWTARIIGSPFIVLPVLAVYLAAVIPILDDFAPLMLRPDLDGLAALLGTPAGTTVVWCHLIAFDLFIGRWMYLDSRERRVHPLLVGPVLVLTILLSPFGLLAYFVLRAVAARPASVHYGPPGAAALRDSH